MEFMADGEPHLVWILVANPKAWSFGNRCGVSQGGGCVKQAPLSSSAYLCQSGDPTCPEPGHEGRRVDGIVEALELVCRHEQKELRRQGLNDAQSFGTDFLGLVDDNNWMRGGNPSGDMGLFKQATAGVAGLIEVADVGIERLGEGAPAMCNLVGEAIDGHADEAAAKRGLAREALIEATAGRVHERER